MNIMELYAQTPVERHHEILVSGDRVFFENEEYVIDAEGELKLIRSQKGLVLSLSKELEQHLAQIETKLGIK